MKGVGETEIYLGRNVGKYKNNNKTTYFTSAQKYISTVIEKIEGLIHTTL